MKFETLLTPSYIYICKILNKHGVCFQLNSNKYTMVSKVSQGVVSGLRARVQRS